MIKNYALLLEQKRFNTINEFNASDVLGGVKAKAQGSSDPTGAIDLSAGTGEQASASTPDNGDNIPYDQSQEAKDNTTSQNTQTEPAKPVDQAKPADPAKPAVDLNKVFNDIMKANSAETKALQTAIGAKLDGVTPSPTGTEVSGVQFKGPDGANLEAKVKVSTVQENGASWLKVDLISVSQAGASGTGGGASSLSGKYANLKLNAGVVVGQVKSLQQIINLLNPAAKLVPDGRFGPKTAAALGVVLGQPGQPVNEITKEISDKLDKIIADAVAKGTISQAALTAAQQALTSTGANAAPNTGQKAGGAAGGASAHVAGSTITAETAKTLANELYAASSGMGTDEPRLQKALLQIKTSGDIASVNKALVAANQVNGETTVFGWFKSEWSPTDADDRKYFEPVLAQWKKNGVDITELSAYASTAPTGPGKAPVPVKQANVSESQLASRYIRRR